MGGQNSKYNHNARLSNDLDHKSWINYSFHSCSCKHVMNKTIYCTRGCGGKSNIYYNILLCTVAPAIKFLAHYDYKNPALATLKGISTTITKVIKYYTPCK